MPFWMLWFSFFDLHFMSMCQYDVSSSSMIRLWESVLKSMGDHRWEHGVYFSRFATVEDNQGWEPTSKYCPSPYLWEIALIFRLKNIGSSDLINTMILREVTCLFPQPSLLEMFTPRLCELIPPKWQRGKTVNSRLSETGTVLTNSILSACS